MNIKAKLMNKGRRVGFLFDNGEKLLDYDILIRMRSGLDMGLKYTNGRFRLLNGKRISDLPEIKYSIGVESRRNNIDVYTGDTLRNLVRESGVRRYKRRDFVGDVLKYCRGDYKYVYGIAGLRGVGKTVGILQAIDSLNLYNNSVFITMNRDSFVDMQDIYDIINSMGKNYVFIDEITTVVSFTSRSCFLYDRYINNGYEVVVSGTDSYALYASLKDALFHRMYINTVTYISYAEVKRLFGFSLKDYLDMGGLYRAEPIEDVDGLLDYIDTSVVSNIINTITRNSIDFNNRLFNREEIRAGVLYILYAIILSKVTSSKRVMFKSLVNIIVEDISRSEIIEVLSLDLGFTLEPIKPKIINSLLSILKRIGLLIEVNNIGNGGGSKYYITNPAVANQVYLSIFRCFKKSNFEIKENLFKDGKLIFSQIKGFLFESMVLSQVYFKTNYSLYYYKDIHGREIDLVVVDERDVTFEGGIACYEIKLATDMNKAYDKSKWLVSDDIYNYFGADQEVLERAVIYNGRTTEKEGILFINADEFLLRTKEVLGRVLDRKV